MLADQSRLAGMQSLTVSVLCHVPDILGHTQERPMAPARIGSAAYRYDQTHLHLFQLHWASVVWLSVAGGTEKHMLCRLVLRNIATSVELSCGSLFCENVGQQTFHRSRLPGVKAMCVSVRHQRSEN